MYHWVFCRIQRVFHRRLVIGAMGFTVLLGYGQWCEAQLDPVQRMRNVLIDYFQSQAYIPVIINRGYVVGDVVEMDGVNLHARAARCFPSLKLPPPVPASLPGFVETDTAGAGFLLGLRRLIEADADADLVKEVQIRYLDVSVVAAATMDFRDALDRTACPELVPLVMGTWSPIVKGQTPYFIVSEVLTGREEITVKVSDSSSASVQAAKIARIFASAKVTARAAAQNEVVLTTKDPIPIAVRPLTIPNVVQASAFNLRGEETPPRVEWRPVTCTSDETCTKEFLPFAELMKAWKPDLTASQVNGAQ
jgi:hypothetical protein